MTSIRVLVRLLLPERLDLDFFLLVRVCNLVRACNLVIYTELCGLKPCNFNDFINLFLFE